MDCVCRGGGDDCQQQGTTFFFVQNVKLLDECKLTKNVCLGVEVLAVVIFSVL